MQREESKSSKSSENCKIIKNSTASINHPTTTTSSDSGKNTSTTSKNTSYDDLTQNAITASHKVVNLTQHLKQSRATRSLTAYQNIVETTSSSSTGSIESLDKNHHPHDVPELANSAAQMLKQIENEMIDQKVVMDSVIDDDVTKKQLNQLEILEIHRLKSEMSIPHSHVSRKSSNDNQSTHSSMLSAGDSAAAYNYSKALNGGSFPQYIDCRYYAKGWKKSFIEFSVKFRCFYDFSNIFCSPRRRPTC